MAVTTNYSWVTPDDTSLVKDGAAAIRTLGSSIDTTTKNLNPSTTLGDIEYRSSTANTKTRVGVGTTGQALTVVGGVPSWAASATSTLTTTGDTLYASGANTLSRLGIGSTGQVLTVAGGVPSWATASSGGMTLINTGGTTFANGTNTISSIPSTYQSLFIVIEDWFPFDNAAWIQMRFNSDSTASRHNSSTTNPITATSFSLTNARMSPAQSNSAPGTSLTTIEIPNYANTSTWKYAISNSLTNNNTTNSDLNFSQYYAFYNQIGAISSLQFSTGVSNTFGSGAGLSGTIYVYGVK